MDADQPTPVLTAFGRLLEDRPNAPLFSFFDEDGRERETRSAAQLAAEGERVARSLRRRGLAPGERCLLVYLPSLDFVAALLGCLIAGVIPVPVYPPNPLRPKHDLPGLAAVAASSGARVALTHTAYERSRRLGMAAARLRRDPSCWPALAWQRTDRRGPAGAPPPWHEPSDPQEPALLQYTSGSTAAPRGVMISHANLAHEIAANAADLALGPGARAVSWLPQYHDFGLVSVILSTIAGNAHSSLMSPLTFLHWPEVWFEVMSQVRATHTAAPNFAFDLAVRRTTPAQRRRWDLSSLQVVMSAAEPIRAATVDAFLDAFACTGLRRDAFYPAYGLAEHTVSVSMGGRARLLLDRDELERGRALPVDDRHPGLAVACVGCGRVTKPGARVRIVDPETRRPGPEGRVGEIWVDSPTKALGYFGAEETSEAFRATVCGDDDPREYLRTGDLGFLHGQELFVTGRLKDVIVNRGRNVHPLDIEDSVRRCHPLVRAGGVAAFSVTDPQSRDDDERLVLFVEVRDDQLDRAAVGALITAVRRSVHEDHQLPCQTIVVGRPGLVRKTTSGKVRRGACRQAFLAGEADASKTHVVFVAS